MNFNDDLSYSDKYIEKNYISQHNFVDSIKKLFNIPNNNNYQNNEITIFYKELLSISKELQLGEDISIKTVYDGKIPEKVFTIHTSVKLEKKQKFALFDEIHEHMESFSKSRGLQNFFKDAYILIK